MANAQPSGHDAAAPMAPARPGRARAHRAPAGPGALVMSSRGLAGDRIVDRRGEELGLLEHIMIDVASGCVAYGVLARGGVFGLGATLFAIPWEALTLDAARQCFVLGVERERLDRARGFDRDRWPAMADPAWAAEVHAHYGRAPYWAQPRER
jgi:sporulation protein YlmC with PRC-barrel domain